MKAKQHFRAATFCFWVLFITAPLCAQKKLSLIVKLSEPSVVAVTTYDAAGRPFRQGSGFFINWSGDIITNRHVLQGANYAEAETVQGKTYPITHILAEDDESDIIQVAIKIPVEAVKPIPLIPSMPETGEQIVVIGAPLGLERTVSEGIVAAVRENTDFGKIIQISAPISPGSSGSPVLNMLGQVVGIAAFQMVEGQNLNFAIPAERIFKLKTGKPIALSEWLPDQHETQPDSAMGLYAVGLMFLQKQDYQEALPYFEKAVEQNLTYTEAYRRIGYCQVNLGRYFEAIEAYRQAIRTRPEDAATYRELAGAFSRFGRLSEALAAYKQALRIDRNDAQAHYGLGVVYGKFGKFARAIAAFQESIHLNPANVSARHALATAYHHRRDYEKAILAYKEAVRINPDHAQSHKGLGIAYLNIGDKAAALDEYQILKNMKSELADSLFARIYD